MMPKDVLKVCLIDDDPSFRFLTRKLCEKIPGIHELEEYEDIYDALRFFMANKKQQEQLPDVILLDLDFPTLNGWEFLEGFIDLEQTLSKDIRIYLVSSSILKSDHEKAKEYEIIHGFIHKPLEMEELKKIVSDSLKAR